MISDDQLAALDALERGDHLIAQSLPGCGKSELLKQIVCQWPARHILALSFNRDLVAAITKGLRQTGLEHQCRAMTFHSLVSALSGQAISDDLLFNRALRLPFVQYANKSFRQVSMLFIDEAADMKRAFFRLVTRFILEVCTDIEQLQIVIAGDSNQLLYDFYAINKADKRYLTAASELFEPIFEHYSVFRNPEFRPRTWTNVTFPVSYRTSPQVANFLNALLPSLGIVSGHPPTAHKATNYVTLYLASLHADAPQIVHDIVKKKSPATYGDVAVLCHSLNGRSPAHDIADFLLANHIPVYINRKGLHRSQSANDASPDITKQKVGLHTYHSAKGQTFGEVVVLVGCRLFLGSIPNALLVALSRSSSLLHVVLDNRSVSQDEVAAFLQRNTHLKQRDLRIIAMQHIPKTLPVTKTPNDILRETADYTRNNLTCEKLLAFLDVDHLECLVERIAASTVSPGIWIEEAQAQMVDNEAEFVLQQQMAYVEANTLSFDGTTHANVAHLCSLALQFATEFVFTLQTPRYFANLRSTLVTQTDTKSCRMLHMLDDARSSIQTNAVLAACARTDVIGRAHVVLDLMPAFGALAVVHDAFWSYSEFLYAVSTFDFLRGSEVERRLLGLVSAVDCVFAMHGLAFSKELWQWQVQKTVKLVHDKQPVSLQVRTAFLYRGDCNVAIYFAPGVTTCHNDRISALIAAHSLFTEDPNMRNSHVYVLNSVDVSLECVSMAESKEPNLPGALLAMALDFRMWDVDGQTSELSDRDFVVQHVHELESYLVATSADKRSE